MPRKHSVDPLLLDSPLAPPPKRRRSRHADAAGDASSSPSEAPAALPAPDGGAPRRGRDGDGGAPTLRHEIIGIVLLVGALFVAGALLFGRTPASLESCAAAGGPFGPVGGCLRWSILGLVGAIAAAIVPLIPATRALRLLGRIGTPERAVVDLFPVGLVVIVPVAAGLARLGVVASGTADPYAGLWGAFAGFYLAEALGRGGAWFVIVTAISVLTAVTLRWNPVRAAVAVKLPTRRAPEPAMALTTAEAMEPDAAELPAVDLTLMGMTAALPVPAEAATPNVEEAGDVDDATDSEDEAIESAEPTAPRRRARKAAGAALAAGATAAGATAAGATTLAGGAATIADDLLPDPALLTAAPVRNTEAGRAQLDLMGAKLIDSLKTFKVEGTLTGRTSGPTVTQYEIEPAPGVKVRQFANLANDLALAMRAPSIRVVAPIPGKGAVGIEVPNPAPEMVAFREIIEADAYQKKPMALPVALGKDLEGQPVVTDLAKMPHLLIAGATGSGKSVCVNTIITSLIYRHTPKTLRFLMVDPKMVELSVYNTLPHLRHKVVTDNRDAAAVLKWAVLEMQERYALLAENGSRNIQDFNTKVRAGAALRKPKDPNVGFENREYTGGVLPYIVVVIDELADLMMTCAAEVETPLAMLAQKARAIGIHLILATQRPSVNVITGLIKANFPSRIAFRVASQIDSRTILDGMGAESLLGNGDMLFIPPGKSEPSRLQGAYLSNEDTERLMGWYAERAGGITPAASADEPDILAAVRAREALEAGGGDEGSEETGDRDKLFREAAEVCIQHQGGSTSLLQRRLKIGYGRAARIIDQLHLAGVLGAPDGSKPRDVLIGLEDLDRVAGTRTAA
ncbi:MAG: DNA translocase FtsK [Gemmatimonadota bacterium]|nr:DNA translocase FtsK [Gemmatimonadota bacterium]MDQ8146708.1 DNA translocase FtsK [Gemmatimonadota bacterium]MDQ8149125.1 DNA translocase FtsK [Gemmatimonadota bacterium]MDQ8157256.1 DNA translocase FtsK [Gemmatimonadota bacterium]MDQ8176061.1 DNA translocase FtsK [Gemmatimonadota bacterium]